MSVFFYTIYLSYECLRAVLQRPAMLGAINNRKIEVCCNRRLRESKFNKRRSGMSGYKSKQLQSMWTEKYRPRCLDDLIISDEVRRAGERIIKTGKVQNLLLYGSYGIGKTTFAEIIIKSLDLQARSIKSRHRNEVREMYDLSAGTTVLGYNFVGYIDEADLLRRDAQKELLRYLEGYDTTITSTIMIANDIHKIHDGVKSRAKELDFDLKEKDLASCTEKLRDRVAFILDSEGVVYKDADIQGFIEELFIDNNGDIRKLINELQGSVNESGELVPL